MIYFFLFLFGLALGSFLNVLSFRYKPGFFLFSKKVVGGRSRCPVCQRQLRWFELIPLLSFFFLRGRCRTCRAPLSWQYPAVELLSGFILMAVPYWLFTKQKVFFAAWAAQGGFLQFLPFWFSLFWVLVFLVLLLIVLIDIRYYLIPDVLNLALALLGLGLLAGQTLVLFKKYSFWSFLGYYSWILDFSFLFSGSPFVRFLASHFLAALLAMLFFIILIILSRGRGLGFGDVKLVGAMGLIFGWPDIVIILIFAFLSGTIFSLPLLLTGRKTLKDILPFAPFLAFAAALVFFFGFDILDSYFRFFGL
jgi:leader peptidase (prepilin peptidase)/N-methyltransferase